MKRDLNLIPKTDSPPIFTKFILPIFLLLVLYASAGYMGWSIPNENLHQKESEYNLLTQKVLDLAHVETDYQNLRAQISEIEAKQKTISQTTSTSKAVHEILDIIEESSPEDIVFTTIELSNDGLVLMGYSYSNTTIAEFAVNVRNVDRFSTVNITSVIPQVVSFEETQETQVSGTDAQELRAFVISISYTIETNPFDEEGDTT